MFVYPQHNVSYIISIQINDGYNGEIGAIPSPLFTKKCIVNLYVYSIWFIVKVIIK